MGICASCLGFARRDSHDSESARLLDEDIYQPGYSYGTVQTHRHGPDPEDLKREREALDAICQRASDTVVDIWTIHPQQLAPSVRGTITSTKATSPRLPTNGRTTTPTPQPPSKPDDTLSPISPTNTQTRTDRSPSSIPGEVGGMKYVACRDPRFEQNTDFSTVPRHWGEVVMTNRRQRKKRPAINGDNTNGNGNLTDDLFGTLVVK